jgi:hypothetical protein
LLNAAGMRACLVTLVLLVGIAHADPPGLTPPNVADTGSYRLQTAGLDAASLGVFALALHEDSGTLGALAIANYVAGPPLLHMYRRHPGRAVASVVFRVGLPLLGAAIGSSLASSRCSCDDLGDLDGVIWGFIAGAAAASVIDVGLLSRGDDVAARSIQAPPASSGPALASPERHEVHVGLAFAF